MKGIPFPGSLFVIETGQGRRKSLPCPSKSGSGQDIVMRKGEMEGL